MFALNSNEKNAYDEETAFCWTGSINEFCESMRS